MFDFLTRKAKGAVPPALPEGTVRRRYSIEGQVQGVGFRYRARYAAQSLELTGWVQNEDDGSVTLEVQGSPDKFMTLFALIQKSDYIQITGIRQKDLPPDPWERGFSVRGMRKTKMAGTQVPAIFACMMIYPAIFRGELLVQMVPSSSRVTAKVPFTLIRAGSSA